MACSVYISWCRTSFLFRFVGTKEKPPFHLLPWEPEVTSDSFNASQWCGAQVSRGHLLMLLGIWSLFSYPQEAHTVPGRPGHDMGAGVPIGSQWKRTRKGVPRPKQKTHFCFPRGDEAWGREITVLVHWCTPCHRCMDFRGSSSGNEQFHITVQFIYFPNHPVLPWSS